MGKKSIPDRWLDYLPLGQCISGTKIVAFKVPLQLNVCQRRLPKNKWFTPAILLERQPQLKTIIDLTNTHRYYNGNEEFGTKGIDHVKILVEGKGTIPADSQLQRFFDAVDAHMLKYVRDTDALIGVHCTHGLNRTGYFVCRWMIDRLKMDPDDAIRRFNNARGHEIERAPLINHLKTSFGSTIFRPLPLSPRRNEYSSPLDDPSYDEPFQQRNRYRYGRDRGNSTQSWSKRERSPRNNDDHDPRSNRNEQYDRRWHKKQTDCTPVMNWRVRDELQSYGGDQRSSRSDTIEEQGERRRNGEVNWRNTQPSRPADGNWRARDETGDALSSARRRNRNRTWRKND